MKHTVLKFRKLHVWTSGSIIEPNAHLWMDCKPRKNRVGTYKSVNIFPSLYRKKLLITNKVPNWLQTLLEDYDNWKNWVQQFYGDDLIFDDFGNMYADPNWEMPKRPLLIVYLYQQWKRREKIRKCTHPNLQEETNISPESGSADYYCPDCGLSEHVCYY